MWVYPAQLSGPVDCNSFTLAWICPTWQLKVREFFHGSGDRVEQPGHTAILAALARMYAATGDRAEQPGHMPTLAALARVYAVGVPCGVIVPGFWGG